MAPTTYTTPLLDRIEARNGAVERPKVIALRPTWLRRMTEQGLPPKDFSNGSFVPTGSDRPA